MAITHTSRTGKKYYLHEAASDFSWVERFALPSVRVDSEAIAEPFANYQAVLRFILIDDERRLFEPERFCFRGSIDGWISIGSAGSIEKLAAKYLKHLGRESIYEL